MHCCTQMIDQRVEKFHIVAVNQSALSAITVLPVAILQLTISRYFFPFSPFIIGDLSLVCNPT
jgi:hypothetical protein